jgi:hypothetical protein
MDTMLAKQDWTNVLVLAQKLHDATWENRASGELGIIAFLEGDVREGTRRVGAALRQAEAESDWSTVSRFLTISGEYDLRD